MWKNAFWKLFTNKFWKFDKNFHCRIKKFKLSSAVRRFCACARAGLPAVVVVALRILRARWFYGKSGEERLSRAGAVAWITGKKCSLAFFWESRWPAGRESIVRGRLIFGCQSTNQRACGDHLVIVFCSNAVSELAYMSQLGNSSAISRGLISWRLSDSNLTPRLKVEWGTTH